MREQQKSCASFYEYGFRDYDAQLARWHCIDPSAESYIASSPYHFAGNNPIVNREIDGANFQQEFDDEARRYLESAKNSKGGGGVYRNAYLGYGGADDGYTYDWSTGQYKNADGRTVSWGEVGNSLGNKGSILTPTSENMKENGISGYATSIDGKIIKVYIDGFGEVDVDQLFHHINQIGGITQMKSMWCAFAIGQMLYAKHNVPAGSQENIANDYYQATGEDPYSDKPANVRVYLERYFGSSSNGLISSWNDIVSAVKKDVPIIAGLKGADVGHAIYIYGVSNANGYNEVYYWDPWPFSGGYKQMSFNDYQTKIFFTYAVRVPY